MQLLPLLLLPWQQLELLPHPLLPYWLHPHPLRLWQLLKRPLLLWPLPLPEPQQHLPQLCLRLLQLQPISQFLL